MKGPSPPSLFPGSARSVLHVAVSLLTLLHPDRGRGARAAEDEELTVGVILPEEDKGAYWWSLPLTRHAVELAVEKVERKGLLAGWRVRVEYRDSGCSETRGPLAAVDVYYRKRNSSLVFLGPACDFALAPVARFSRRWGVPVVTAGGLVKAFGDKRRYSLLTRVMAPYTKAGQFLARVLGHYHWRKVGLVFHDKSTPGTRSDCYFVMEAMLSALIRDTVDVPWYLSFDQARMSGTGDYVEMLSKVRLNTRIVILCASSTAVRELMIAAHQLNFHTGDFAFFNIDLFSSQEQQTTPWQREADSEERNTIAKEAYYAMMTVTLRRPRSPAYRQFSEAVKARAGQKRPHAFGEGEVNSFVGAFHDAVILYALALNESLEAGIPITNGSEITQRMWNRTFEGITGQVSIDANGDREADYCLMDYEQGTGIARTVVVYLAEQNKLILTNASVHWPGPNSRPPTDNPECGFDNSKCPQDPFPEYALVLVILAVVFLTSLLVCFFVYRIIRTEADLTEMSWRIPRSEIVLTRTQTGYPQGRAPRDSPGLAVSISSMLGSWGSVSTAASLWTLTRDTGDKGSKGPTRAVYRGMTVVVKELSDSTMNLSKAHLEDMKHLKELQSNHVTQFVGVCIDPPTPLMLTEYCAKGSLKGLAYLHDSSIHSHGNLKSSNCMVDGRFVIKITDFDLKHLRRKQPREVENIDMAWYQRQLWTAPELLRLSPRGAGGTQEGDIYSLAIVCHEIVCREGVFHLPDSGYTPQKIYEEVKAGIRPVLRPSLDLLTHPSDDLDPDLGLRLKNTIARCWDERAERRPSAASLKRLIQALPHNKGKGQAGLVDRMLTRLEQYANNLEALVAERTQDYLEEKKKAEDLLYSMLPEPVAQCLIRGQQVVAETFESVTIYFSDICGFTALSAASTPMQVVTLLNDLYTMFDSILEHYDVYKVETIGDAYMVVSGLPRVNGKRHALNIARMALDLLRNVASFTIGHRPGDRLQLRMGVHSGSVVAGVVGLKMPRYCLFGDTVNTTSRMESNGLPLKIHISQQTKDLLDEFGNFLISLRGNLELKGKGTQTTYWLEGENTEGDESE